MNTANYITVTEFQDFNPELDFTNYTNATISGMISRASQEVDDYLEYSLGVEEISNEKSECVISNNGNLMIYTKKMPIISVSSISLKLGTTSLNLSLTDSSGNDRYDIPTRARYILYPYQELAITGAFSIRNFYQLRNAEIFTKVSYRAGYTTIPHSIKDAVNLWTKEIFTRQSNPMDIKSSSQGAVNVSFRDKDERGDGSFIKQAKTILQDYKKVV